MPTRSRVSGRNDEYNVTVEDVNIADPGIAFLLDLEKTGNRSAQGLRLTLTIDDLSHNRTATSVLNILNPINDPRLSVVMPFGDADYFGDEIFDYSLEISFLDASHNPLGGTEWAPITLNGSGVEGHWGIFEAIDIRFGLKPGDALFPGQYLRSPNYEYFGHMGYDGCFRVFRGTPGAFAVPLLRDTTPTAGDGLTQLEYQENGQVAIVHIVNDSVEREAFINEVHIPPIGRLELDRDGALKIVNTSTNQVEFNVTDHSYLFHPPQ